MDDIKMSLMT